MDISQLNIKEMLYIHHLTNLPKELYESMLVKKDVAENHYYLAKSTGFGTGRRVAMEKIASLN